MSGLISDEDVVALYDGHARQLHRYLARRVGTSAADDLVAESFLVVWRQRKGYDPTRGSLKSWLYGIATKLLSRHARSEIRRLEAWGREHGRREIVDTIDDRIVDMVDAQAIVGDVANTIASLRHAERDVLLLVAWAGLTPTEVSAALGVPVVTVRTRLHRARTKVRDQMITPSRQSVHSQKESGHA